MTGRAPFQDVAEHIVQAPGIRFLEPHGMRSFDTVVTEPRIVVERIPIFAAAIGRGASGTACVYPLRFRR
jgi:hypothetical protein